MSSSRGRKRKKEEMIEDVTDDNDDDDMDIIHGPPARKKRRIISSPLLSSIEQSRDNNHNHNSRDDDHDEDGDGDGDFTDDPFSILSLKSEFSCTESSQFSCDESQSSWHGLSQQSTRSDSPHRFAQNLPDVILQEILSYNTPFELSVCAVINKFYNEQTQICWTRLTQCTISPAAFPSLIDDDYDSQFEYNPSRHPHRTHFTLNWVIRKLNVCHHLQTLNIVRTMMNGQMFQTLIKNCPHLTTLHLDENPWIFLLGMNHQKKREDLENSMDIDAGDMVQDENEMEMYTANLFDTLPTFQLQSFTLESMYMNMTDLTFNRLLKSSTASLQELTLKKRDPFHCSYCNKSSLCKWHKCEDCNLRSYCCRQCQSDDWWQHQYVCSYHDPQGVLQRLQGDNRLNGGFLDTICRFQNLITLDLTWCYIVHHTALTLISLNCVKLQNIILNGCDVSDDGIIALATNLENIQTLHCRAARYVTDRSMECLATHCHQSLKDLDVSRCCLITKEGCLGVIQQCHQLEQLSMACAIKRGGWMWTMDDELAKEILMNLKQLKLLEYIYADNGRLSTKYQQKLYNIKDIVIQTITTERQTELRNVNGRLTVVVIKESMHEDPVFMERIENGQVMEEYSHQFKR